MIPAASLPNIRHKARVTVFRIMSVSSSTTSNFNNVLQPSCPGQVVVGTTGFWSRVSRIPRRHCCRRRRFQQPSPPSTITIRHEPLDETDDLASHLRAVHEQYRAGLVSEKDFRRVKASMLVLVLRRRSEASAASTTSQGGSSSSSSSSSGFFTMSSPSEFRSSIDPAND